MKKIITAAAIAAMAASFAAAEVKTSINFRMGTNAFNNPDVSSDKVTYGDLGDITGTDAFTFKASNDYAGITLNYNPLSARSNEDKGTTRDGSNAKTFWSNGNGVEYTGYMRPAEWLELKGGVHKDGIFYAEQVKKDTDDTNWSAAGKYAFLYKLGATTKNSTGYFMDDMTSYQNGGTPFFWADFKFDVGGGDFLVRPIVADTGKNWLLTGGYNNKWAATPGLVVAWNKKDLLNINLDVQSISNNDIAAGLYASPVVLDGLQLTIGGTFSTILDDDKDAVGYKTADGDGVTFFAFDLRARYVAGDFHISNVFNYTGASEDKAVKQAASTATARTADSNIWDSLFLTYKLNDKITLTGNVQVQVALNAVAGTDDDATFVDLAVTPGVMYTVGKGAAITAGLYTTFNDLTEAVDDGRTIGVALPVLFRIKL